MHALLVDALHKNLGGNAQVAMKGLLMPLQQHALKPWKPHCVSALYPAGMGGQFKTPEHPGCVPQSPPPPTHTHTPVCQWWFLAVHGCHCVAHTAKYVDDGVVLQHVLVAAH